jgi:hypothetical protein
MCVFSVKKCRIIAEKRNKFAIFALNFAVWVRILPSFQGNLLYFKMLCSVCLVFGMQRFFDMAG